MEKIDQIGIKDLELSYFDSNGKKFLILNKINLNIKEGDITAIFGSNGCGKTTLLNVISGIQKQNSGKIEYSKKLKIGYVFQEYRESLLPWKKMWVNIAFPLFINGESKSEAYKKVKKLVSETKMNLNLEAYPFMLSGGQAQMVSILRALIINPDVLIIDEPFSSLDYINHINTMMKIRELHKKRKFTILFVSHDIDEAILLSNKLVLLSNKPTKVLNEVDINLPIQRDVNLMTSNKFVEIKAEMLRLINRPL